MIWTINPGSLNARSTEDAQGLCTIFPPLTAHALSLSLSPQRANTPTRMRRVRRAEKGKLSVNFSPVTRVCDRTGQSGRSKMAARNGGGEGQRESLAGALSEPADCATHGDLDHTWQQTPPNPQAPEVLLHSLHRMGKRVIGDRSQG